MGKVANGGAAFNPAAVTVKINRRPLKSRGGETVPHELLDAQAEVVRANLVPVDYRKKRGSCVDERPRASLRNGRPAEVRPSVPGGPDIYALGIAELIGFFGTADPGSAPECLAVVQQQLRRAGYRSGGHDGCAANAGLAGCMQLLAGAPPAVTAYAKAQLQDRYDEALAAAVIDNAGAAVASRRYEHWREAALAESLGDEAGEAIERLADVPHTAATLVRNQVPGTALDQNAVYGQSVLGKGSFDMDDAYADALEHVLSGGPDAVRQRRLAEHAREFMLGALVQALPNEELYQIDLLPA